MGQVAFLHFFLFAFLFFLVFLLSPLLEAAQRSCCWCSQVFCSTLCIKSTMKRLRTLSVHQFSPSTVRSGEQECAMKKWNYLKELSLEHCFILQEALDLALRKEYIFKHISLSRIQYHSPLEFTDSTLHWCFQLVENQCFSGCSTPYLCAYNTSKNGYFYN